MESLRDPYNVLTVGNFIGGLGFAYWTTTKWKESSDLAKEQATKLDTLAKTVAELHNAVNQMGGGVNNRIIGIQQSIEADRKAITRLNREADEAMSAVLKLIKAEKKRDPQFKVKFGKGKKKARYESDTDESDSESEEEDDRKKKRRNGRNRRSDDERDDRRNNRRNDDDEVVMRQRRT